MYQIVIYKPNRYFLQNCHRGESLDLTTAIFLAEYLPGVLFISILPFHATRTQVDAHPILTLRCRCSSQTHWRLPKSDCKCKALRAPRSRFWISFVNWGLVGSTRQVHSRAHPYDNSSVSEYSWLMVQVELLDMHGTNLHTQSHCVSRQVDRSPMVCDFYRKCIILLLGMQ